MLLKQKLFLSFDIESTGDSPYSGSMIMLGVAGILEEKILMENLDDEKDSIFYCEKQWCIQDYNEYPLDITNDIRDGKELEIRTTNEKCSEYLKKSERCHTEFWSKQVNLRQFILQNQQHPRTVATEFSEFLANLKKSFDVRFIAAPSAFDWQFLNYFYDRFGDFDKTPLGFKAICISTMKDTLKTVFGKEKIQTLITSPTLRLTHYAIDDAKLQAYEFAKMHAFIQNRNWRELAGVTAFETA